jgi:wyosine [tRNA(Phe)-imidazoG37] synthetase (radical SAM superfamily)
MKTKKYQYLFGPVPSRRFGRSLGVDLTPYKTCTLDCVFCQLGRTLEKTIVRREYVPTAAVLAELEEWLKAGGRADYITLSGSGEPTLHSRFGEVLEFIRKNSTIPGVLLTNGTLLSLPEVQDAASHAGVVKTSLSAWDENSYFWMNRPYAELRFDDLVEGQKEFRARFKGQLWLEVFLINGMNTRVADVKKIASLAKEISPDRIHLNTAIRPPAEDFVTVLPKECMETLARLFSPLAEIIGEYHTDSTGETRANQYMILSMLQRRPCSARQIAETYGMHLNDVSKYLGKLMRSGKIRAVRRDATLYYSVLKGEGEKNA